MTEMSVFTEARAKPWLRIAEHRLKGKRYMTAKRPSSIMKIDSSIAGSVLVVLGWKKISNKTYERGASK